MIIFMLFHLHLCTNICLSLLIISKIIKFSLTIFIEFVQINVLSVMNLLLQEKVFIQSIWLIQQQMTIWYLHVFLILVEQYTCLNTCTAQVFNTGYLFPIIGYHCNSKIRQNHHLYFSDGYIFTNFFYKWKFSY